MMKSRLVAYLIHLIVISLLWYCLAHILGTGNKWIFNGFLFFVLFSQYVLLTSRVKFPMWSKLLFAVLIWFISMSAGFYVFAKFAFNKRGDPAEIIGVISYMFVTVLLNEIYFFFSKRYK